MGATASFRAAFRARGSALLDTGSRDLPDGALALRRLSDDAVPTRRELLNFGAFVGFILVNLSVIRHFYLRLRQRSGVQILTTWSFRSWALSYAVFWWNLSLKARLAGFCWLGSASSTRRDYAWLRVGAQISQQP